MSKTLKAVIVDAATGEIIERDFTETEIAEHKTRQAELAASQAEVKAKAAARESALAKLADLGLTAEEIASL